MDNSNLTQTMQEMQAQMMAMRAELNDLKQQAKVVNRPQPEPESVEQPTPPLVSTTRRRTLRRLAGGLVAGLAVGSVAAARPQQAQAKFVAAGGAGAIVMPSGATLSGSPSNGNTYGLVGTPDSTLAMSSLSSVTKAGVVGITAATTSFSYGVFGSGVVGIFGTGNTAVTGNSGVNGLGYYGVVGNGTQNGVRGISIKGIGVYGSSSNSTGIEGNSTAGTGVYGNSTEGAGVFGSSTNNSGVFGSSTNISAVVGVSTNNAGVAGFGGTFGVYGTGGPGGGTAGVRGDGENIGVWGVGLNGGVGMYAIHGPNNPTAAVFVGNVTKTGGTFKIDHPLDPANKYLYHSFVESPDMMNIYNGIATLDNQGEATVEMPSWFEALNRDFRYQLTSIGKSMPDLFIAEEIKQLRFKIAGGLAGQRVSWMVTGIRQDGWAKAHPIVVEEDKNEKEKGFYLHPEVFGQPKEKSVNTLLVK